ncbi:hypothetical protein LA080_009322 [Diaporthe eres]|nr:hypothetical protein LA080_009322 [Diaporthe eres]
MMDSQKETRTRDFGFRGSGGVLLLDRWGAHSTYVVRGCFGPPGTEAREGVEVSCEKKAQSGYNTPQQQAGTTGCARRNNEAAMLPCSRVQPVNWPQVPRPRGTDGAAQVAAARGLVWSCETPRDLGDNRDDEDGTSRGLLYQCAAQPSLINLNLNNSLRRPQDGECHSTSISISTSRPVACRRQEVEAQTTATAAPSEVRAGVENSGQELLKNSNPCSVQAFGRRVWGRNACAAAVIGLPIASYAAQTLGLRQVAPSMLCRRGWASHAAADRQSVST